MHRDTTGFAKPARPAMRYHLATQHDRWSLQGHGLDWKNQPDVFKTYPDALKLSTHPLPEPKNYPHISLAQALQATPQPGAQCSEAALGRALMQGYGLTALSRHRSGDFYYRSAPSAGALYPGELYVALGAPLDVATSESGPCLGLHHYDPLRHRLVSLGRQRALHDVVEACALPGAPPTAALIASAIFFRSSWKYRARAWRYCLLDVGHMLENLLLALRAEGLAASLHYDFNDTALNGLLGVDTSLEAALAVVFIHGQEAEAPPALEEPFQEPEAARLEPASRVAAQEEHYQEIAAAHQSGVLQDGAAGCGRSLQLQWDDVLEQGVEFAPLTVNAPPEAPGLHKGALSRRSKRNFVPEPLTPQEAGALAGAMCALDGDSLERDAPESPLLVAMAAQQAGGAPLQDGLYALRRGDCSLARLHAGSVNEALAHVCLGQEWLKNANLHCLFCTNLEALEETCGPRGYRYAMLEAGRLGERAYLAASCMGLGACGIGAFFDQEAAMLLGVEHKAQLLYMVAAGKVRR